MTKKILHRTLLATATLAALSSGVVHAAGTGLVSGTLNTLTGNGAAIAGVPGANNQLQMLAHNVDQAITPAGSPLAGLNGLPQLSSEALPGLAGDKNGPLLTTDSLGLNKATGATLAGIDLSPTIEIAHGDKLVNMYNDNGQGSVKVDSKSDGKVSVRAKADYAAGDDVTGPLDYKYDVGYTTP